MEDLDKSNGNTEQTNNKSERNAKHNKIIQKLNKSQTETPKLHNN